MTGADSRLLEQPAWPALEQLNEHQAAAVAARRRGTPPADVVDGLMARLGFRRVVPLAPAGSP